MSVFKKLEFNPKIENIVKGLTLCLISIILMINVGKVARTFAFIPLYLFGGAYYAIFFLIFLYGLSRIIFRKKIKLKEANIIFSVPLFVFSMFFFLSVYGSPSGISVGDAINGYNSNLATYYTRTTINAFSSASGFKNGILGLALGVGINNDTVSIFLGIMLLVVSLLIFFMPLITNWIKGNKNKEKLIIVDEKTRLLQPLLKLIILYLVKNQ